MDKQYVFATHMGVGNRGCEALTQSLCTLLKLPSTNTIIYTKHYEEDNESNITQFGRVMRTNKWEKSNILYRSFWKIVALIKNDDDMLMLKKYNINEINKDSTVLMTGGDLYCYEGTVKLMGFIHRYANKKGASSVLIGCSIEDKFLSEEVISDLLEYEFITVRESLSFNNLVQNGINKNVFLIPDSAFVIKPDAIDLRIMPNTVGINISPYVVGDDEALFIRNIQILVLYILEETTYNIMFIPHVFWEEQDDRLSIYNIYDCYKEYSDRVQILDADKLSYSQIRYVISKCRFFIGARTHSVISAYSTQIPAIALGYSIKARGIAQDIGMDSKTVVNCKKLKDDKQLVEAFMYLEKNELEIKAMLKKNIPRYINDAGKIKNIWERWIRNELE